MTKPEMMERLLIDATLVEEGRNVEHTDLRVLREEEGLVAWFKKVVGKDDFHNRGIHERDESFSVIDAEILGNLRKEAFDVRNKLMRWQVALCFVVYIFFIAVVFLLFKRVFIIFIAATCVFLILVYCAVVSNSQKNADALAADRRYILQGDGRNMTGVL